LSETGILLGLLAAFTWGVADFFARFAAQRVGNIRTLFYMQLMGLVGISFWLFLFEPNIKWDWPLVALAALLGVGNTIAGLCLYRSFEVGLLAVVSPIAASYGAITLCLGLLTGQRPRVSELLGLVVVIVGVILASTPLTFGRNVQKAKKPDKKPLRYRVQSALANGVGLAIAAALVWGVVFWGLGYVSPTLGGILPVWEMRFIAPVVIFGLARATKASLSLPDKTSLWWIFGIAVFDTGAYIAYNKGLQFAESGLVAVIASLFSAVTILLAWLFLREKLAANQWAGVFIILIGMALVGGLVKF
jgi:drug/metabolite transporter (DMT)-like permease